MGIDDLLKYFGRPVTNPAFDDFLSRNGVEERFEYSSDSGIPFALLEIPVSGISMEFIKPREFADDFGAVQEDGDLLFSKVFLYIAAEDNYYAYSGAWPSVVPKPTLPEACISKLGHPDFIRDEDDDFGQTNTVEYTWDQTNGYSVFVRFTKQPLAVRHIVITPARVRGTLNASHHD
ncbi:hypothetical protein LFL96_06490 [Paraburkholderia sp. D15]|uniref:hypothetical protein n=1 Tax=Paraburkholderia sp. D15 TaxID=2880218 RepID=UPI00247A3CD8|nr:hypothetical protein [Paraburkholderia sp. D15]WGS51147.1 hypothetical protein LFL96_06490 [Paraburkholderia sp. D15]